MPQESSIHNRFSYLALLCVAVTLPAEGLAQTFVEMSGIRPNQVFQRNGTLPTSEATIHLKAVDAVASNCTHYSVSLLTASNGVERVLKYAYYDRSVPLSFSLATGKSRRRVRVSFFDGSTECRRWDSPGFSVGEVFLVAGQSNGANHGTTDGVTETVDPSFFHTAVDASTNTWSELKEPLPFATFWPAGTNGSPWLSFAKTLGDRYQVPVALINVAYGGSPVEWWLPGGVDTRPGSTYGTPVAERLFQGARAVTTELSTTETDVEKRFHCSFRAVLWHQGESNAQRAAPSRIEYANNLKAVAQEFRTRTGCAQPWMIAKVSWLADHWRQEDNLPLGEDKVAAEAAIRRAQHYLATRVPEIGSRQPIFQLGPDTDMLAGEYREATGLDAKYRRDGLHLRRKALTLHGRMWAERVARTLGADATAVEPVETLIPEVKAVWNVYANSMGRAPADIIQDTEGLRYWVRDLVLRNIVDDTQVNSIASSLYAPMMQSTTEYAVRQTFLQNVARAATATEVSYWVGEIAASRETQATVATKIKVEMNPTWDASKKKAWLLYIRIMNRTTPEMANDMAGVDYWASVLRNGTPESTVEAAFKTSPEYIVRDAFMKAKLRQPTQSELNYFMPRLSTEFANDPTRLADALWAQTSN